MWLHQGCEPSSCFSHSQTPVETSTVYPLVCCHIKSAFSFFPSSIRTTVLLPSEFFGTPAERARLTSPGGKHHSGRESGGLNQHVWSLSRLPAACVCLPWRKLGPTVYTTSLPVRLSREAFEMSRDTDKSGSLWGGLFRKESAPFSCNMIYNQ